MLIMYLFRLVYYSLLNETQNEVSSLQLNLQLNLQFIKAMFNFIQQ